MVNIRDARAADARGIATVHIESWRTSYSDILPGEFLASLDIDQREQRWQQIIGLEPQMFVVVAEDESGQIIGFANGGPSRDQELPYSGEVYAIYLLKDSQRRGIGRSLMQAACGHLSSRGWNSMLIWVLADNPSRHFYEALGGKSVSEKEIEIGGRMFKEVGYGWDQLSTLLNAK